MRLYLCLVTLTCTGIAVATAVQEWNTARWGSFVMIGVALFALLVTLRIATDKGELPHG